VTSVGSKHRLQIVAILNGADGPISIDDIDYKHGTCPDPPVDHFDCGNGESVPQDQVCDFVQDCSNGNDDDSNLCGTMCEFEELGGTCGWQSSEDYDFAWHRKNVTGDLCNNQGLCQDHSFGNDTYGIVTLDPTNNDMSLLGQAPFASPWLQRSHSSCLFQIWYDKLEASLNRLFVLNNFLFSSGFIRWERNCQRPTSN
jgi:hypothetical protein